MASEYEPWRTEGISEASYWRRAYLEARKDVAATTRSQQLPNFNIDLPHTEAADIVLKIRRLDLAFAELQTAWDEFRKVGEWQVKDRRILDRFGNYICNADDAPMLYRFMNGEPEDAIREADGHDLPYKQRDTLAD